MLPEHFFDVTGNGTVAVLSAKHSYTFSFLGFSGEASARPEETHINSVVLRPSTRSSKENPDVLAVTAIWEQTLSKGQTKIEYHRFVLPVYYTEGEDGSKGQRVVVDLQEIYVPKEFLQPYTEHVLLKIDDNIFTSKSHFRSEGEIYVSDANLLCRLAAGRATTKEVLEVAEKPKREKDEREKLTRENEDLRVALEYRQKAFERERENLADRVSLMRAAERCIDKCLLLSGPIKFIDREILRYPLFLTKKWRLAEIERICAKYFESVKSITS